MNLAKARYNQQKNNARKRGIPFLFSFSDWTDWWEKELGPDWLKLRGTKKGQFCMARYGDCGPYERTNVYCTLHSQNCSDMKETGRIACGEVSGTHKLTETEVVDIFTSKTPVKELQNQYGISAGAIIDIRTRRTWERVTANIDRDSLRGRNQWK